MSVDNKTSVLFVCLGNICRSPMAQGIFTHLVYEHNRQDAFYIDSAGTGSWHIGHPPDKRAQQVCTKNGVNISKLQARKIHKMDLFHYDYVLAMDERNMRDIKRYYADTPEQANKVSLILNYYYDEPIKNVPDPYYGAHDGFEYVFDILYKSCVNLLETLDKK